MNKSTPRDQRSSAKQSYSLHWLISGQLYERVPENFLALFFRVANPKSPILSVKSFVTNIFSGLMSRWAIPFECICLIPSSICLKKVKAIFSGNPSCLATRLKRSPRSQYSKIPQMFEYLLQSSFNISTSSILMTLTTFGWERLDCVLNSFKILSDVDIGFFCNLRIQGS